MLSNMEHMMCEIEDSKMYSYSIGAMSEVAKQFNYGTVNMDSMYKRLTSTQDKLHEFHDASEEIRAVMSESADYTISITDEDLEQELQALMVDDGLDTTTEIPSFLRPTNPGVMIQIENLPGRSAGRGALHGDSEDDETFPDPPRMGAQRPHMAATATATATAAATATTKPPPIESIRERFQLQTLV